MENGWFGNTQVQLAKEQKDCWPYGESCSDLEDVKGCQQLKQHVLDDRWCCTMPFLDLSGFICCCMCGNSERQLPSVRLPTAQTQAGQ